MQYKDKKCEHKSSSSEYNQIWKILKNLNMLSLNITIDQKQKFTEEFKKLLD